MGSGFGSVRAGLLWGGVVARERSAEPAAWPARKFCGIAYDTLHSPAPFAAFFFISYIRRGGAGQKEGYNKWVQVYLVCECICVGMSSSISWTQQASGLLSAPAGYTHKVTPYAGY